MGSEYNLDTNLIRNSIRKISHLMNILTTFITKIAIILRAKTVESNVLDKIFLMINNISF